MEEFKEASRSVVMNDNVNLTSLSFADLLRLIVNSVNRDEASELEAAEKISVEKLKKLGSLENLVKEAINKMERLGEKSVTLNISSTYLPYIDDVVNNKTGWGRFYDITYMKRDIPINVKHKFLCVIRKRGQ